MSGATRFGLIAMSFLALSAPAAGFCEVMGERMDSCAMVEMHEMSGCADEMALSASCCEPADTDATPDLILSRPDDDLEAPANAGSAFTLAAPPIAASLLRARDPAPPPRAAPYRLNSALLL